MSVDFKHIEQRDIDYFKSVIPAERLYIGEAQIHEDYSHDELADVHRYPEVLAEVVCTSEISKLLKYCYENSIPVTPRGQGTGLVGAGVALNGGLMISTVKMNQFIELDEDNLTLTVEPGVLLMEISKYVEDHDLFYPPDPGEKSATIGGNVSTNAGGMRAVKYGVTRDFVRGLEVVLMNGEILEVGGKVVKNSSGYSLKDMVVGAEGTLGFISKIILRLLPLPKVAISLLVPFPSLDIAVETVPKIIKSKSIPTAIEYMERRVIENAEDFLGKKFPDSSSDAYLLLTFDGNSKEEVESNYEKVANICLEAGALDVLISDTQERQESIWSARGAFLEAIKASTTEMDECDVVVPRDKVAEFVKYTKAVETRVNIRIASFGHAGDGNLHVYVLKDDYSEDVFKEKLEEAFNLLYKRAEELKGHVSGEHGIGFAKLPYLRAQHGEMYMTLLKNIKLAFDPKGLLNPGKVC